MLKKVFSFLFFLSLLLASCNLKGGESLTSSSTASDNAVTSVPALGPKGQQIFHVGLNETAYCGVYCTDEQTAYMANLNIPKTEYVFRVAGVVSEQDTSGLVFSTVTATNSEGLYWCNLIKIICVKEFKEKILISEIQVERKKGFVVNYGIDLQLIFNPDYVTQPAFNEYRELGVNALGDYMFKANEPFFTELHQLNHDGNHYVGFLMGLGDSRFYLNYFHPIETEALKFEGTFFKCVYNYDDWGYIDHTKGDVAPFPETGMSCLKSSDQDYFVFFTKSVTFSDLTEYVVYGTDFVFNVSYQGESYNIHKHLLLSKLP